MKIGIYTNTDDRNDLRLEHYDFSVPPQKINRNISPEPKQVVKPTKDELELHKSYLKTNLKRNFFN